MTFHDFHLKPPVQRAIDEAGFIEPSPVQQAAIPLILEGCDIIAQAQTGTGKTAAFGLPLMHMMQANGDVETLVIVPTRELAMQVSDELYRFGKYAGIHTATVYGGASYSRQIERINRASVVVATPGRLLDLLRSGKITLNPSFVVLDEADEMLDMGFLDEIKAIFTYLPSKRQTLMFSATMPSAIRRLAQEILHRPQTVSITKKERTNTAISQYYYVVQEHERDDALVRLIDYKTPQKAIVFCRMKKEVDRLVTHLRAQGFNTEGLHGDMQQRQRETAIRSFKQGETDIFVATDVAARGLDVHNVTHVFNYHIPFDSESYVHRIGRTGRGGKTGEAITLVTPDELRTIKRIEKDVGAKLITQNVPTRIDVHDRRRNDLIARILATEVTPQAVELVKTLQHELDIVAIAHLLAAALEEDTSVRGKEHIGFDTKQIEKLIEKAMRRHDTNRRSSYRRRGYRNERRNASRTRRR